MSPLRHLSLLHCVGVRWRQNRSAVFRRGLDPAGDRGPMTFSAADCGISQSDMRPERSGTSASQLSSAAPSGRSAFR